MHNIHELEQRWFKYKLRSYLPHFITLVFSSILAVALIFIYDSKQNTPYTQTTKKKTLDTKEDIQAIERAHKKKLVENIEIKPTHKPIESTPSSSLKLEPSLGFIQNIGNSSINRYEPENNYKPRTQKKVVKKKTQKKIEKKKVVKSKPVYKDTTTKSKINISTRQTQNDIKNVIKRFKKNNNPALSLFVAKKYYKLGNYKKSYDYALITNNINNEIEQSWLIFAKSLVKLKKKDQAIKTLRKYIRHSGSGNAKVLLDDIKSGKFR